MNGYLDAQELRDLLAEEVTDACEVIAAAALALERGDRSGSEGARRAAHSTRGAAATLGVVEVATVAYELEMLFAALEEGHGVATSAVTAAVLDAVDALRTSREGILRGAVVPGSLAAATQALTVVLRQPADPAGGRR